LPRELSEIHGHAFKVCRLGAGELTDLRLAYLLNGQQHPCLVMGAGECRMHGMELAFIL
jgi:hypothetical protein